MRVGCITCCSPSCAQRHSFPQDPGGFEVALNELEHLVQRWEALATDILNDAVKRQIFLADISWALELRGPALGDHVIPRRLTRLECDSQSLGLRFNTNGGGRTDTAATQMRCQGLREEGLWQDTEEVRRSI